MTSRRPLTPGPSSRLAVVTALFVLSSGALAADFPVGSLEFLGEAALERGLEFEGTPVGGLSAITWDAERHVYHVVADDPGRRAPARFYTLRIDLSSGRLAADGAVVVGVTELRDRRGEPFAEFVIDGEGLALTPARTLLLSSEGNVRRGVPPSLREVGLDGGERRRFRVPRKARPNRAGTRGVRHNLVFEGLTLSPDGRRFFVGLENALAQDGPAADLERGSPARILEFDLGGGRELAEYVYLTDPVLAAPRPGDGHRVNGLVELLALGGRRLLALERSYSQGVGNSVRLFLVDLAGATDVRRVRALAGFAGELRPAVKELLLDLGQLGLELDNLEGMTFGPDLPDGRRTLVLISDDNFDSRSQKSQVLAFALSAEPVEIAEIQGRGHGSALEGFWVREVSGVVTAVDRGERSAGFWMQSPVADDAAATSDGLGVATAGVPEVEPGDMVRVSGRVIESGFPGGLTVTRLAAERIDVLSSGEPLPAPVAIGAGGREPPAENLDDDGLASYEPGTDGLDFWESLEGMRVEVGDAVVVGPTTRYGGFVVVADGGAGAGRRTPRGGLVLEPDDAHPERLPVSSRLASEVPGLAVGARFEQPLVGVLDYEFGHYRLLYTEPLPPVAAAGPADEATRLRGGPGALTLATYNVLNLDALDGDERFARVAASIVEDLGAPDLVALQEIQDDSGRQDDGTVSAAGTLGLLVEAVAAAGGPRYEFRQIDPLDGETGGEPVGNIRNAFLFDPARLSLEDRPGGDAVTAVRVEDSPDGPRLDPNPGRVAPRAPAFLADEESGFEPSRRPLAAELSFAGRRLFLVNLHLKSKRGDDSLFGPRQPPVHGSEVQRMAQVREVGELVRRLLDRDPCALVVVLGDFNEFDFRPPLRAFADYDLVNLMESVLVEDRYTYVYEGASQALDHILVSRALARYAAPEIDAVHVNADLPDRGRASDHDPVVAKLSVAAVPRADCR